MNQLEIVPRGRCEIWVDLVSGKTVSIIGVMNEVISMSRKFITLLSVESVRDPYGERISATDPIYETLFAEGMKHIDSANVRILRILDSPDALAATISPSEDEGGDSSDEE